jgi:hypothetical protein
VGWESTGREAVEEKERKMKRWRGIESICFRLMQKKKQSMGLLCMGLQCLVYGKNAGVLVFYVWVA